MFENRLTVSFYYEVFLFLDQQTPQGVFTVALCSASGLCVTPGHDSCAVQEDEDEEVPKDADRGAHKNQSVSVLDAREAVREDSYNHLEAFILRRRLKVHRAYADSCKEKGETPLSRQAFSRLLHEQNMSIFAPRAERSVQQSVQFEHGDLSTEDWETHRNKRDQSANSTDKELAMRENVLRAVSGSEIFVPSDYEFKIKSARVKGEPYNVKYVSNSLFKDFSKVSNLTTIRPGPKAGDSQVVEIPCLRWLDHLLQTGAWGITSGKTSLVKGVKRMDNI
ncbi:hypothetical protein RRG08_045217 [Elysia crispata]|uniref:Uncharacterized protein n=1 Tax=Elysia crispata TaxID=231223 RepID=A0AAE1A2U5_9GAST|nr:hypothetical protein RRG08_045217 [Elysia crispata]